MIFLTKFVLKNHFAKVGREFQSKKDFSRKMISEKQVTVHQNSEETKFIEQTLKK